MLKEYDRLEAEISKAASNDMQKAKELSKQKKALLVKMSKQELETLLKRPYPAQYKKIIRKYL